MANPPPPKMPAPPKKPLAPWRRQVGMAAPWLCFVFAVGGAMQAFLAGYGLAELGGQGLDYHVNFAHVIEFLPVLILAAGFIGADNRTGIVGVVLLVLFQAQYAFIQAGGPFVHALHPLNGVVMVVLAFAAFMRGIVWTPKAKTI